MRTKQVAAEQRAGVVVAIGSADGEERQVSFEASAVQLGMGGAFGAWEGGDDAPDWTATARRWRKVVGVRRILLWQQCCRIGGGVKHRVVARIVAQSIERGCGR